MTLPNQDSTISLPLPAIAGDSPASHSEIEVEVIALFDELQERLFGYVLSFGLSVHDAEDVVQETFLSLFRHLQLGRPRQNLRGWIFRVGHNLALKRRAAAQSGRSRGVSTANFIGVNVGQASCLSVTAASRRS